MSPSLGPVARFVAALLLVGLAACSSPVDVTDDPERALREAFEELAATDAIELTVHLDGEVADAEVPGLPTEGAAAPLLLGTQLQVRSSTSDPAHARVETVDAAAAEALDEAAEQLRRIGLSPLAAALVAGDWVRISVPPTAAVDGDVGDDGDRLARGLGQAGTRLLDDATAVAHLASDDGIDRVEVTAERVTVRRFLDEVVAAVSATGQPEDSDGQAPPAADTAGPAGEEVTVEVRLEDGTVRALRLDLHELEGTGRSPLVLHVEMAQPTSEDLPADAPPFALRALVQDTLAAAASPGGEPLGDAGDSDAGEPAEEGGAEEAAGPTDPPPFREGGALEEAFGDDNPFADVDQFDCISPEELEIAEGTFGPEVVAEIEELIELGYLRTC